MNEYEVLIEKRKNSICSNFVEPIRMVLSAKSKKQVIDFAYELFYADYFISRYKVKITADKI